MNWYSKLAAISPETSGHLHEEGWQIVDSVITQGYDLYLFQSESFVAEMIAKALNLTLPVYQIGIQREDTDFGNIEQQHQKFKIPRIPNIFKLQSEMKNKIAEWINKYGKLVAASHNANKNKKYSKLLSVLGVPHTIKQAFGMSIILIG